MISDQQILKHIQRAPRSTAGYKQLLREMGLRGQERRELEERLQAMVKRGELAKIGRDRYALPTTPAKARDGRNLVSGRLQMHRDGFGFVIPDSESLKQKIEGDIFIPPPQIGVAMHGDQVLVEL